MQRHIGPTTEFSNYLHKTKYRLEDESFKEFSIRFSSTLSDDTNHYHRLLEMVQYQRFLPAGRVQSAVGSPYNITAMNCFTGSEIHDSMEGIMDELKNSALTLRMGGGCGWDFSTIRPSGDKISTLSAEASGPVSMMGMWDSMCNTIMSKGLRRGAMMGVLRVDHPDIMTFIQAKRDQNTLSNFNISVAITDEFMQALQNGDKYELKFNDKVYGHLDAGVVWDEIMSNTWDWAEPGVLFIDTINKMNPLNYTETIAATNPCGEVPLPPNGACLLGSFNIVQYLQDIGDNPKLDLDVLKEDVKAAVRAIDNVIDETKYPLTQQELEAKLKRRMGLGVTGMANALEILGHPYASDSYIKNQELILTALRDTAYMTSIELAIEKGSFPLFDADKWLESGFAKTLPEDIKSGIKEHGLRNGLLLSIAPTGTISLCADNVSSGIEPPYMLEGDRKIRLPEGDKLVNVKDWALQFANVKCRTAEDISVEDHVKVLTSAQKYIDHAVSKTCNVADNVDFKDFKEVYMQAYKGGAKGCTTFRASGKRYGIMNSQTKENTELEHTEGAACFLDPETGMKECS